VTVQNPPEGMQRIIPYLAYADAPAAIEFLCRAFGFEEVYRMEMPDGRVGHCQLRRGTDQLWLGSVFAEMGMAAPSELPAFHSQIAVWVEDVDAHHAQAVAAGAEVTEPEEQPHGAKMYRAVDPGGHRWLFMTQVRDVDLSTL
jgi:PhnB protein